MKAKLKKYATLIVAILVPVLATLFVAATVYLPGLFVQPKYDFLYSVGDYYSAYRVDQGKLQFEPSGYEYELDAYRTEPVETPKLFMYDLASNQSHEISRDEASKLTLDGNRTSPDGFEIISGDTEGLGLFSYRSQSDWFISGHNISHKLNIQTNGGYTQLSFVAWVKE